MPFIRSASAFAAAICAASAGVAEGARSLLNCLESPNGVKTIQPQSTTDVGPGQNPEAVVAILSARLRIVDSVPGAGLFITKSTLSAPLAFGGGQPNGYTGGGPRNPDGPWVGLTWPYRDFNDGYAPVGTGTPPLGNDIGTISPPGPLNPGQYLVSGIAGAMAFSPTNPNSYMRGIPGNGGNGFATYFSIDIGSTNPLRRMVTVFLEDVEVRALIEDSDGRLITENQRAPDISLSFEIPTPASAPILLGLAALGRRRR